MLQSMAARAEIPAVRVGRAGEWKDHFNEEQRALFSLHAGTILERFGYERS